MFLGLEASTSSVKALLFDPGKGIVRESQKSYNSHTSDMVSMDGPGVFDALIDLAKECISGVEKNIEGIAMATIWNSLLFYDQVMDPLDRLVTWADRSGDLTLFDKKASDFTETGCPQAYKFARWQLMREKEQDYIKKAAKIGFLSDYLFMKMTGKWSTTRMAAAGSGLLDLKTGSWNEKALADIGVSSNMLPPLVDYKVKQVISKSIARKLGLSESTEVGFPNGDGGLNQLGEGKLEEGVMSMSIGTSGAVRVLTDQLPLAEDEGLWWHYLEKGCYIAGASIAGAGNCLDWYMNMSGWNKGPSGHEDLTLALSKRDLSQAPLFLPFLYGEQSPGWQRDRNWGFTHASIDLTYYSVLEGILFNLYQGYEMIRESLYEPSVIKLSGGILHSPYWIQLAADVFNKPMVISDIIHGSLYGAFSVMCDQMPDRKRGRVVYPSFHANLAAARYQAYKVAYEKSQVNLIRYRVNQPSLED